MVIFYKELTLVTVVFSLICAGFFHFAAVKIQHADNVPLVLVKFFDPLLFEQGKAEVKKNGCCRTISGIKGLIVPHHLLPSTMLSEAFQTLVQARPRTVVLIGPNHHEVGTASIQHATFNWLTPFGQVYVNSSPENIFAPAKLEHAENEHSLSGMMPYIRTYLPKATVRSFMIRRYASVEELERFISKVKKLDTEETVYIASVDFSHYLSSSVAEANDAKTLAWIKSFSLKSIMNSNNDYMDSPPSIYVLLRLMQEFKTTKFTLLGNTNSGRILKDPYIETTSYITATFSR
ncbi:MAG TPA: AmmeMemoRadiSam system protein B [Patescibacteria group bacterium]|nr:AmmeMemoRadiSam system protein B [Patescibacteria group bacterium]